MANKNPFLTDAKAHMKCPCVCVTIEKLYDFVFSYPGGLLTINRAETGGKAR